MKKICQPAIYQPTEAEQAHFLETALMTDDSRLFEKEKALMRSGKFGIVECVMDEEEARYRHESKPIASENGQGYRKHWRAYDLSKSVWLCEPELTREQAFCASIKGLAIEEVKQERLEEEFDESLGHYVDSVKVMQADNRYKIAIDYDLTPRQVQSILYQGTFNAEEKVWEVAHDKSTVRFLVHLLLKEIVADRAARQRAERTASDYSLKVEDAFTGNGASYTGKILAMSNHYVLQHSSKEHATIHRAHLLTPRYALFYCLCKNLSITYQDGEGNVSRLDMT